MKFKRKNTYKWNLTFYLWAKWNIIFQRRIQRRSCNNFLRHGNVAQTYILCFWLKIIFSNAIIFDWKLLFWVYIDFRQGPYFAKKLWWLDFFTSYLQLGACFEGKTYSPVYSFRRLSNPNFQIDKNKGGDW